MVFKIFYCLIALDLIQLRRSEMEYFPFNLFELEVKTISVFFLLACSTKNFRFFFNENAMVIFFFLFNWKLSMTFCLKKTAALLFGKHQMNQTVCRLDGSAETGTNGRLKMQSLPEYEHPGEVLVKKILEFYSPKLPPVQKTKKLLSNKPIYVKD